MASPCNCLAAFLPNTFVMSLEAYFSAAEGANSNDNLVAGRKIRGV